MSFISLPIEIIIQIFDLLDESEPSKPYDFRRHREMCKTLMALRLTCKELEEIAIRQLFRTFCLSPSLESWIKLHTIANSQKLQVYLQILALERQKDPDKMISWNKSTYELMIKTISKIPLPSMDDHSRFNAWERSMYEIMGKISPKTPLPFTLDLALLSNLKVLKAEDRWVITKKPQSIIKIEPGYCEISAICFFRRSPTIWSVFNGLEEILRYGFQISWVNCKLGDNGPWESLLRMDLSSLKSLRLYPEIIHGNNVWDARADEKLLAKLHHLPSLEEFYLYQDFCGRSDANRPMLETVTNVLKQLTAKDWPRLRHLDLRYLVTTVEDFQTFVAPHAATLQTFQMYGGLVSSQVTSKEKMQRFHLLRWIRSVICPKGGGAKFEHLLEPWEELYYDEDLDDYTEEEDTEEESNEEEGREEKCKEEEVTEEEDSEEEGTEEEGTEEEGIEEEDNADECIEEGGQDG